LTWAGFFVPLVVENQRYDSSPLFSLWPIHATKPIRWCNNLPLNGSAGDLRGNFIIAKVTRKDGSTTTFPG